MKSYYNDFYQNFGRIMHDLREQQTQDITEYVENGLSEDEIMRITDMDRRSIRDIILKIKIDENLQLNERFWFDVNIKGWDSFKMYASDEDKLKKDVQKSLKNPKDLISIEKVKTPENQDEKVVLTPKETQINEMQAFMQPLFKISKTQKGTLEFKGGKLTLDSKSAQIILDIIDHEQKWPQYQLRDAIQNPKRYTTKDVVKLVKLAQKAQGDKRPLTQMK